MKLFVAQILLLAAAQHVALAQVNVFLPKVRGRNLKDTKTPKTTSPPGATKTPKSAKGIPCGWTQMENDMIVTTVTSYTGDCGDLVNSCEKGDQASLCNGYGGDCCMCAMYEGNCTFTTPPSF